MLEAQAQYTGYAPPTTFPPTVVFEIYFSFLFVFI